MTKKERKKASKFGYKLGSKRRSVESVRLNLQLKDKEKPDNALEVIAHGTTQMTRKKKQLKGDKNDLIEDGMNYHFDVWFHIGRFVAPESVRTFSLLCHGCWEVTLTVQFWLSLYHRHVTHFEKLPSRLRPLDIDAGSGLQSRVIRALYYIYPPFTTVKRDFTNHVVNKKCSTFWWVKEFNVKKNCFTWNYFLKFTDINWTKQTFHNCLFANPEKYNMVVKAKCPNYILLEHASCSNMILTSFHDCMSSDMRYHKLKMIFHEERKGKQYAKEHGSLLIINPVIEYSIIPWWEPNYPHSVR